MNKLFLFLSLLFSVKSISQPDTTRWIRAFPITDYIVDASDSVKIVQLFLPAATGLVIQDKQLGLLRGVYVAQHTDTAIIGVGRCNLRKGEYYYFTINYKNSDKLPKKGDLIYTFVGEIPPYKGRIIKLASNYIGLQNVYENPLYDRYNVFQNWREINESAVIDSMVSDVHFTGKYFLDNSPSMDVKIKGGKYEGKMVFNIMIASTRKDIIDFLDYIIARPRLYAGREWKISEIFATWLSAGAPMVPK